MDAARSLEIRTSCEFREFCTSCEFRGFCTSCGFREFCEFCKFCEFCEFCKFRVRLTPDTPAPAPDATAPDATEPDVPEPEPEPDIPEPEPDVPFRRRRSSSDFDGIDFDGVARKAPDGDSEVFGKAVGWDVFFTSLRTTPFCGTGNVRV